MTLESPAHATARPIVVVGMDRSGTSLIANLVHVWGAYGGDPTKLSRGHPQYNARGFWENDEHQEILSS